MSYVPFLFNEFPIMSILDLTQRKKETPNHWWSDHSLGHRTTVIGGHKKYFFHTNSLVTSVPLHRWKKYMIRGFNQSELLAQSFAQKSSIPYQKLFHKKKRTRSQTNYSKHKRQSNVHGSFSLSWYVDLSTVETVIIVDDVITTGSTLNTLAECIKQDYPHLKVYGLVIARHG